MSLGNMLADDPITIKTLKAAKRDKDPEVKEAAKTALWQIENGEAYVPEEKPAPAPVAVEEPAPAPAGAGFLMAPLTTHHT